MMKTNEAIMKDVMAHYGHVNDKTLLLQKKLLSLFSWLKCAHTKILFHFLHFSQQNTHIHTSCELWIKNTCWRIVN